MALSAETAPGQDRVCAALLLGRVLGGIGVACNQPAGMVFLLDCYPRSERSVPLGCASPMQCVASDCRVSAVVRRRNETRRYWTASLTVSPTVGIVVGGLLVENLSWRWLFWIQLPPALLALAVGFYALRNPEASGQRKKPFDFLGTVSLGLFTLSLLFCVNQGRMRASPESCRTIYLGPLHLGPSCGASSPCNISKHLKLVPVPPPHCSPSHAG
jgi:MFS family permease